MRLEDQCCAKLQAKRLQELQIEQAAYFVWGLRSDTPNPLWIIEGTEDEFYSAFTVAELGALLPDMIVTDFAQYELVIIKEAEDEWLCLYCRANNLTDMHPEIGSCGGKTQAEAMATILILLLEKGKIDLEECNQRLLQ